MFSYRLTFKAIITIMDTLYILFQNGLKVAIIFFSFHTYTL